MSNVMRNPFANSKTLTISLELAKMTDPETAIILHFINNLVKGNEALKNEEYFKEGKYWVEVSYDELGKMLPLGIRTLKRRLTELRNMGLMEGKSFSNEPWDRTLWYSVNTDKINEMILKWRDQNEQ